MKHSSLLLRVAAIGTLAFSFTSCQKILDHWPGHGHGGHDSTVEYRIKSVEYKMTDDREPFMLRKAIFKYGTDNVLDSVVTTGDHPNLEETLYFTYNQNGALVAYTKNRFSPPYSGHNIEHKYGIGSGNRVVADSLNYSGFAFGYSDRSQFEYDAQSRIARDFHKFNADGSQIPLDTVTFNYDSNGNRKVVDVGTYHYASTGGGVTDSTVYDNKIAYRSTNPIFQLIDRDYSKNNSNLATGYNAAGLPLGFAEGSREEFLDLGEPRVIEWEEVP